MSPRFQDFNEERREGYRKDPETENFLRRLNRALVPLERSLYRDTAPPHPFVFVFGLPRSGTTLMSQLLAHCLELGYIDNVAARFWLAPLCGLRLSRALLDRSAYVGFHSQYGSTEDLRDIHEFGYFWMHWLQKTTFEDIRDAKTREEELDWSGLRQVLANLQVELDRGLVAKNIYGSYHMARLSRVLGDVLWVRTQRDELDTAVSILDARRRHYEDASRWWSYVPPAYEKVIDAEPRTQIAGQIHHLSEFWDEEVRDPDVQDRVLVIDYERMCRDPRRVLDRVRSVLRDRFGCQVGLEQEPPQSFEPTTYDRPEDKAAFSDLLKRLREESSDE